MMKRISKYVVAALLSVTLSTVWLAEPVSAQVDDAIARPAVQDDTDNFDWGWLGLIGLLGLAGLMKRDRNDLRGTATTTTRT